MTKDLDESSLIQTDISDEARDDLIKELSLADSLEVSNVKEPINYRGYRLHFKTDTKAKTLTFYAPDLAEFFDIENDELDMSFEMGDTPAELNNFDRGTYEGVCLYDMYNGGKPTYVFARAISFTKNKEIDDKIWELIYAAQRLDG